MDMKLCSLNQILIILLPGCALAVSPQVVINEVLSNAPGRESGSGSPGDRMEFVELYNGSGDRTIDIGGWTISDGDAVDRIESWESDGTDSLGGCPVVSGTTRLGPGQYALIFDPEYFEGGEGGWFDIGENTLVVTIGNTSIGNGLSSTDPLVLCDLEGDTISTFGTPGWDDGFPGDPGDGTSWERVDPAGDDNEENWVVSRDAAGRTPGKRNSLSIPIDLSFSANSLALDPSEPSIQERVELTAILRNQGLLGAGFFEIDVYLDQDRDGNVTDDEVVQHITPDLVLFPGDSLTVSGSIVTRDNGYFVVGMRVRHPEDGDPTDNSVEREMRIGDVPARIVVNEIYYDPMRGGEEWIEIYNRSRDPLDIGGWTFMDTRTAGFLEGEALVMESGSYRVLTGDPMGLAEALPYLDDRLVVTVSPFPSLGNRGDTLQLLTTDGYVADRVEYLGGWGGGDGVSLERVNPINNVSGPSNWGSSVDPRGSTPGEENSIHQEYGGGSATLQIDPEVFSPDQDGRDDRTVIRYRLPVPRARVKIEVYDVLGRRVREVLDQVESGSEGQVVWDGKDGRGVTLPVGIYVVYLEAIDPFNKYLLRKKRGVVLGGNL